MPGGARSPWTCYELTVADVLPVLLVGFLLGMRHATDPDHVVAVTTIVSQRPAARAALSVGALWGLGHTLTIFVVGGAIILFGIVIPPHVGLGMELAVALVLIALGLANLAGLRRIPHTHALAEEAPVASRLGRLRPLAVGLVHGLAGSAAIALFVLATIRDPRWALLYLLLFGAGTVAGMVLITSALAVPFALAARKNRALGAVLLRLTGVVSVAFGVFLVYRIGFVDGLFGAHPIWQPE